MVLTQQRIKVGDIFIGIHVEVDIRIILHDLSLFVRKETLDVDIEMIKMVRKFILKGGEQACWRRGGFDPKDIREFFQFTVEDEVIGFISPVGGNDVSARILRAEMVEHVVQGRALVRVLAGLDDDIEESF